MVIIEAVPKDWTGFTAISATTERGYPMDRSGNIWCEGFSKNNGGWPVYHLLDKHQSSEKINDSRETNKIPIQTSKSTVNLDNALGGKSYSEEDFVWSINDRFHDNQTKDSGNSTEVRLGEPAHSSMGREWESVDENRTPGLRQLCRNQHVASVIPVEERPSNKDAYNFNRNTTIEVAIQELSADDGTQCEEDLLMLLNLLKNKYPFCDETNKNLLYDYEFENLCYIEEYTHELISVKKVKDEVDKCYEEGKKTAIVVTDEL
ncbi:16172_t:CDS:2 [Funneliformis mosseae]|uniref:16172_t:CDS:1 n=1 Tax=Funneliformis mosseae TaxID=27381 RepID=A0A9N8ZLC1_FUNMO|nr:16172_t:CDS:2 [Funneliformis mosseae]